MESVSRTVEFYAAAERRIGRLTLVLGLGAALLAGFLLSLPAGIGVGVGAVLAWVNYLWLKEAAHAFTQLAASQADTPRPHISPWVYVRFFGRYALIALVLYVMVARLAVPITSLLSGLLALGAAAMAEGIYEIFARSR